MATESPNSSWHPAFMPNNNDAAPIETPVDATQATSSTEELPAQPIQASEQIPQSQADTEPSYNIETAHALPLQSEDDAGDTSLGAVQPAPELPLEDQSPQLPPNATEPEPPIPSKTKAPASQHSSSMSFARTVSHDLNFDGDDDGDWNLSRTDTDPFNKFMSPSDRTNSFPAVPPLAVRPEHPLPSNQALDVLEEAERDNDADDKEYLSGAVEREEEEKAPSRHHASSKSIGGDIQGFQEQVHDARYEEGLPLIPHGGKEDELHESKEAAATLATSFDDEAGTEDDFFSHAQASGTEDGPNGAPVPFLERKSTMQVLGALSSGPNPRDSALEATQEEDENASVDAAQPEWDASHAVPDQDTPTEPAENEAPTVDLAAKWEEAFADEDDDELEFLVEDSTTENKEVDPSAFFGSDDEGLLDDNEEPIASPQPAPPSGHQSAPASRVPSGSNPYLPQTPAAERPSSSYFPNTAAAIQASPASMYNASVPATPFGSAPQYGAPSQPRPDLARVQSFADKSKGGYQSPYDLPSDLVTSVVKPRKRASMQQLPRATAPQMQAPAPPPRSTSMFMASPPTNTLSPPNSSHGVQAPPAHQKPPAPALHSKDSFFEELPMTARPRPGSRHNQRAPSPAAQSHPPMGHAPHIPSPLMPMAVNQAAAPPQHASSMAPPPAPARAMSEQYTSHHVPGVGELVAPERVSPYAALQTSSQHMPVPATTTSRYSPAPGQGHIVPPVAANNRYSPAPPATKPQGSYGPAGAATAPPILPHQPRTSSPLTHCENNRAIGPNGEPTPAERRTAPSYEPRLNRVSSLPPTREVDEEEDQNAPSRSLSASYAPVTPSDPRFNPMSPPKGARQTPPPPSYAGQATLSPPKRAGPSSYAPHVTYALPPAQPGFVPPPRAQTQSPSAMSRHKPAAASYGHQRRPSSAHSNTTSALANAAYNAYASSRRIRGASLSMTVEEPTDGREKDPLQRWRGVPIFSWSVGGTLVTSFPASIPRYGMNHAVPTIVRTLGEVKVRNIKEIEPLQDRLAKFPGPLRGKSKKKETISWLTDGIESLEKDLPDVSFHAQLSLEAKRSIERLLLWKILRIFVEFDGTLEGTPAVEKAVREVLSPGASTPIAEGNAMFPGAAGIGAESTSFTSMQADGADVSTMDQIRHHLLNGDREKAVWAFVDKRLWGHAMLISHTVSGDLYQQVAQEFVRKEVNYPGHNNESMAALYKILSGNYDDCVDELVPVHARAGLQLVSTASGSGPTKDTLDGLDKWRETLSLVLSNRSADDIRGLNALGNLLSSYGRAEAAHICFLFGRNASVFGGLDDPTANFVLVGSDHHTQSDQFAKETEALQLSEVYEYGLSLAGGPTAAAGVPHLAAYKLQHAMTLAEYGYRDKALQYCDALATAITSQTKRSPYHHILLEAAVEDFMTRLKQAPKGETNSWISKPSMNKVSDSVWNRFNKFVAGDDQENGGAGAGGDPDAGPFGRIATTPTMSRSPSTSNFDIYGSQPAAYPPGAAVQPLATAAASKYAPSAASAPGPSNAYETPSQYAPGRSSTERTSMERTSNEFTRNSYEPSYPGASPPKAMNGGYTPSAFAAPESNYQQDSAPSGPPGLASPAKIIPSQSSGGYQPYGIPGAVNIPGASNMSGINNDVGASGMSMPSFSVGSPERRAEPFSQSYQQPAYGYNPPDMVTNTTELENHDDPADGGSGGYEPPSYGYEPPVYDSEPPDEEDTNAAQPKKKKSFMDDDYDDGFGSTPNFNNNSNPSSNTNAKSDKDRENEEMFRKAAEEDAKRAAATQQGTKKGWGFGGWFGGGKKPESPSPGEASPNKPIKAKLGEASSFVYDPELKRWINKKDGAENTAPKTATPPPPRAGPRSVSSGTPPPPHAMPPPLHSSNSAPPPLMPPRMRAGTPELSKAPSMESLAAPTMMRSVSNSSSAGPPSRPTTSMSNASSIDDLLSAAAPRKPGQKKARKGGRYIDVMAK
ncbi:hypothetical protein G7046_g8008 [Stylonectria norvegica]|nr:hypothetical protein G7046_g8008 [Stylonectria norvegica]